MTREELYELVWTTPVVKAAKALGVSGSYLSRVCFALSVPKPPPGYWAKRYVGQASERPPLLPGAPGSPREWIRHGRDRTVITPFFHHPDRVRSLHGTSTGQYLLSRTAWHLRAAATIVQSKGEYLQPPIRRPTMMDVVTTSEGLEACLAFAEVLVDACESRGHRILMAGAFEGFRRQEIHTGDCAGAASAYDTKHKMWPPRPTIIYFGSRPLGIAVVEATKRVKVRYDGYSTFVPVAEWKGPDTGLTWTTTMSMPTGLVKLVAYRPDSGEDWSQEWSEKVSGSLLRRALAVTKELERAASTMYD